MATEAHGITRKKHQSNTPGTLDVPGSGIDCDDLSPCSGMGLHSELLADRIPAFSMTTNQDALSRKRVPILNLFPPPLGASAG
jgi:hypothetical protein